MGDLWRLWLILGAALSISERVTTRLYFGPAAVGALAAAATAAIGLSFPVQAAAFAAVAVAGLALRGRLLVPYQRALARRGRIAGSATVVEAIGDHPGRVRVGGREWRALSRGQHIQPGTKVAVIGLADEVTVWVYAKETLN